MFALSHLFLCFIERNKHLGGILCSAGQFLLPFYHPGFCGILVVRFASSTDCGMGNKVSRNVRFLLMVFIAVTLLKKKSAPPILKSVYLLCSSTSNSLERSSNI